MKFIVESVIKTLRSEFKGSHEIIKTSDGKELFVRTWLPNKHSSVGVLIFHGITAYSQPYEMMGIPLSKNGYTVYGLDLRGHGLSDGNRGDYPSKERLVADLGQAIQLIKSKHEKLIILGHSLGVVTSLIASNNHLNQIHGLILLSAARETRPGIYKKISFGKKLSILFSSLIKPSKPAISYYREGMLGLDDPLFNFKYTLRFMKIFNVSKTTFSPDLKIPVIVGVGDRDELFTVEAARSLFDEIPSERKEFIIMKGAQHAVFPEGAFDSLINWLNGNFKLNNSEGP